MNATMQLLRLWMTTQGHVTQSDAARALGVKPAAVNNWTRGISQAAPHLVARMAKDLGENPGRWLAQVESERSKDADDRRTWAALAKQLGAAAAVVLAVALPYDVTATGTQAEPDSAMYIMRNWLRHLASRLASMARRPRFGYASPVLA